MVSLRQLAVYHKYDTRSRQSIYVLVTPTPPSKTLVLQKFLGALKELHPAVEPVDQNCLKLNEAILQTYLENWRDYMYDYERQLDILVSFLIISLSSMSL